ncbi:E3 ubiquitin-protein ligase arih1 [Iris pallida]|uniref:RBR-type E3 ubiquitin transferase n=1 Tax=Iris pallida TaxID=29817 RepID=A0AAX6DLT1_IRIPA|nr:E3 ubiquitin-protein ligase arih1 [Iris pallida]
MEEGLESYGEGVFQHSDAEEEEEFESCCEEEEWQDPLETLVEFLSSREEGVDDELLSVDEEVTDEFSLRMFFKGVSIAGDGGLGMRASGIGVVMEKSPGVPVIQVQKKLDFFVEEAVVEHLALLNGLIEAQSNGIRRVFAFTDSREVYQQIAEVEPLEDQLLVALGYRILELANNLEEFSLKLGARSDLLRPLRLARKAVGIVDGSFEECPTCCEEKPQEQIMKLNCCHRFCSDCMIMYVEDELRDMQVPVRCPQVGCKYCIPIKEFKPFLAISVYESLEIATIEAGVMNSDRIYCPFPNCSVLLTPSHCPSSGASTSTQSQSNCIECTDCHRLICTSCVSPWHASMSCEDYQNLSMEERDTEDIALHHLAQNNNWRRCQQCSRMIELTQGCYHVTCWCGYEFCYSCGLEYQDGLQTCQCEFWDDDDDNENSDHSICSNQEAEPYRWEGFNPPPLAAIDGYSDQERAQLALIQRFLAGGFDLGSDQNHNHYPCQSPPRCSDSYLDTIKDLNQLPWLERFVSVISDTYHDEFI